MFYTGRILSITNTVHNRSHILRSPSPLCHLRCVFAIHFVRGICCSSKTTIALPFELTNINLFCTFINGQFIRSNMKRCSDRKRRSGRGTGTRIPLYKWTSECRFTDAYHKLFSKRMKSRELINSLLIYTPHWKLQARDFSVVVCFCFFLSLISVQLAWLGLAVLDIIKCLIWDDVPHSSDSIK